MLQESDSSGESDPDDAGAMFVGRRRKSHASPKHSPQINKKSLDAVAEVKPSKDLFSAQGVDTHESDSESHDVTGSGGASLHPHHRTGDTDSEGSKRSRSVSPSPSGGYEDYIVVSKDKERRDSATLFDWTMIERKPWDEGSGEDSDEDDDDFECKKLYLLVARCISYPFNAKYQIETTPPRTKLSREKFGVLYRTLKASAEDFSAVLWEYESKMSPQDLEVIQNDKFVFCVKWMLNVVLVRAELVDICSSGGFSVKELESIFKVKATIVLSNDRGGLNSSQLSLWCSVFHKIMEQCSRDFTVPYDRRRSKSPSSAAASAAVLNQDKLYKVFQDILRVRSIEHQVLYRECQLGNPEEQEAVVRRELQARKMALQDRGRPLLEGKFGSHKVEDIYREEQLKMLKLLNNNLDQLSLQGTNFATVEKKKKKTSAIDCSSAPALNYKQELHFNLKVKVTIHEVLEVQPALKGKAIFCVFGLVDSGRDPFKTQPVELEYSSVSFGEEGEFWVNSPTPQVYLELRSVSKALLRDSRLVAKHTHTALPSVSDFYSTISLYPSDKKEGQSPVAKLRVSTIVERPSSIKKSGYLVAIGDTMFKQRKRRFCTLLQCKSYQFLFCSYVPNGTMPKDMLPIDQTLTVEYATNNEQFQGETDAKYFFDLVFENSESGRVHFGCRDEAERQSWVEWMVRATGQEVQPQQMGVQEVVRAGDTDLERYGLKEVVDRVKDITSLDPHKLFFKLFRATLDYRHSEELFSRGLFSPAQMYVLDEFCARYGVRDPFRHLTCLQDWLDCIERGVSIWPVMIQSSFCFCQMHIGGLTPPEKSVIVTMEEREVFVEVCQRIEETVTYQLQNFRTCFPFSCPKGDLRTTLKLFDLVSTINQPGSAEKVLTHIMEKGALINYKQVYNKLRKPDADVPLPITVVLEFSRLCIELMYELHDFFWEEFNQSVVFNAYINAFWSFFLVDLKEALTHSDDVILKLQLFHVVNGYFSSQPTMRLEKFHNDFLKCFVPVVVSYIETLEQSLKLELASALAHETWLPVTDKCCVSVDAAVKTMFSFKRFLQELSWPEGSFSGYLEQKVGAICADRLQEAAEVIQVQFYQLMMSEASTPLSYSLPPQFFTMINTLVYLSSQVLQVCASQRVHIADNQNSDPSESNLEHDNSMNIEEHLSGILNATITMAISKLCNPLKDILEKLTKFDPNEGFLASLRMLIPTIIPINAYTDFLTSNLALISTDLVATIFNNMVVNWYECQMQLLSQWLEKRPDFSLHKTQLTSSEEIFKTLYVSFVACEVPPRQLRSQSHDAVEERIRVENSRIDMLSIGKN